MFYCKIHHFSLAVIETAMPCFDCSTVNSLDFRQILPVEFSVVFWIT